MISNKYRGGSVAERFWLVEFKKTLEFVLEGQTAKEIKEKQANDNFLLAKTDDYSKRTVNTVLRRISRMPKNILELFKELDLENQKIIILIAIMFDDRLFFEFVYEIYRPSIMNEDFILSKEKENEFINKKSIESEHFNKFKEYTKKRLISSYRNYLLEADVIVSENKEYVMKRLFLDERLVELLKEHEYEFVLKALVEETHD